MKLIDLQSQRFGKLTVLSKVPRSDNGQTKWLCICDCGRKIVVESRYLRDGTKMNCGCEKKARRPTNFIDLSGQRFGRLTVLRRAEGNYSDWKVRWICKCDCGTEKIISANSLRSGKVVSCGCKKAEDSSERKRLDVLGKTFGELTVLSEAGKIRGCITWNCVCSCGNRRVVRGFDLVHSRITSCHECSVKRASRKVNGGHRARLYTCWNQMKSRCYNPNNKTYSYYGGRGIVVCEDWKNSYKAFSDWAMQNGYTDELSLDRIDVNGNYEPSNCRWATKEEQMNNTRANHYIEYNGETHTISGWASLTGIKASVISSRLRRGWSVERALTEEVKH